MGESFKVLVGNPKTLTQQVNAHLEKGWTLHGNMYPHIITKDGTIFAQAVKLPAPVIDTQPVYSSPSIVDPRESEWL